RHRRGGLPARLHRPLVPPGVPGPFRPALRRGRRLPARRQRGPGTGHRVRTVRRRRDRPYGPPPGGIMIAQLRLAVAAALVLAVTACGSGGDGSGTAAVPADAPPELRTLVEAAKKEGELVWYSVPAEDIAKAVSDDFAKKYGIKVKFIRLTSRDLEQRFGAEAETGKPAA